tara:strand:- start:783 stop:974 length:192 start_codon:yes stop_codon:yes gene_type:complete
MGKCGKGKRWSITKKACVTRRGLLFFAGKKTGKLGRTKLSKDEPTKHTRERGEQAKSKNPRFL